MDLHNMLLERECIDRGILLFDDGRLYLSWIRKGCVRGVALRAYS